MDNCRSLTLDEIEALEQSGCTAEDWNNISVSDDFNPAYVRNTSFCGEISLGVFDKHIEIEEGFMRHSGIFNATLHNVAIGDNCLIENIGNYISGYTIGEECYISNVGRMTCDETATFGEGTPVAVLNEAGDGNVIIYDGITSQMAAFMVNAGQDKTLHGLIREMVKKDCAARRPSSGTVGYRVKIVNTREIINTSIGDDTEINCASRLYDSTLSGTEDASVYIGNDVICENTIVSAGASVLGGAKLYNCFVGEACHVGKGFSAESSVFFANSYMDNGEACAAFCGPFTVSHHKSTLLIGGMFSFYNAGSATNYSNHAYKLGPIHYGTLERGAKTASGAHILMPATIGAFSMCMGKIQNHPDTADMPFSYIIATADKTYLVPGCNLTTVGTYRDTAKWPKRDMRPHTGRKSIVNFNWLSPYTIQKAIRGKKVLERLRTEQCCDTEEYEYGSCVIRKSSLEKGIRIYDMAIKMFFGNAVNTHPCTLPYSAAGTGEWTDLAGMLVPHDELTRLEDDIRSGNISTVAGIVERFTDMNDNYSEWMWNWTYSTILNYYGIETITDDDIRQITCDAENARAAWLSAIARDAEKEAMLGDVDEELLNGFLSSMTGKG
ncbi:DUF4954 family protein [Xylanibacter muris]|uniref:DUF4954 family protein n=1 Tax=Xylanibacter muris TaxID=2736290 RepID=A0ABX2ARR0_9BACT|nr:DUF4954 family protein [Xylanibacter muris]NPD92894.1 DUF4954 family protein [Xylanibacter muris]